MVDLCTVLVLITAVFALPLGSGSAAQQPSYPCEATEAYAEQAQRKLPLHLQATVMGCAALVRGSLLATLLDPSECRSRQDPPASDLLQVQS